MAAVPTSMKAGMQISPRAVRKRPVQAAPSKTINSSEKTVIALQ
jgi:hypothetical protein